MSKVDTEQQLVDDSHARKDSAIGDDIKLELKEAIKAELKAELDVKEDVKDKKEDDKKDDKKEDNKEEDDKEVEDLTSSLANILTVCGKALQKGTSVDNKNIIVIMHSVMESIESLTKTEKAFQRLSGAQKKQLCVDCLHWLVNSQIDMLDAEKIVLNEMIDQIAPAAIDVIIGVSNGASDLVLNIADQLCKPCGCTPVACVNGARCLIM